MTTGTVVGTNTNAGPLQLPINYHGPFYVAFTGLYWLFWNDGTNLVYSSCLTPTGTWAAKATAVSGIGAIYSAVETDGTYLHIAYTSGGALKYVQGTPASSGTISWGSTQTVLSSGIGSASPVIAICISSDGYVCIGYSDASNYPRVIRNGDPSSSATWSTASGFPITLASSAYYFPVVRAGPNGAIYCLCGASSAVQYFYIISSSGSLGSQEIATLSTCADYGIRDMIVANGVSYVIYRHLSSGITFHSRSVAGVWDATETTLATVSGAYPTLQYDSANSKLYAIWIDASNHVVYRVFDGSTWADAVTWIDESTDGGVSQTQLNAPTLTQNNQLIVAYKTKSGSPYSVKVAALSLVTGYSPRIIQPIIKKIVRPTSVNIVKGPGSDYA